MNQNRIKYELQQIRNHHPAFVFMSHHPPYVIIKDISCPARNWRTPTTRLAIKLPPNYPYTQPTAYAPADLTPRDGVTVKHFYRVNKQLREAFPNGPWNWFCLHDLKWDPNYHETANEMNSFKAWLKTPWADNPAKESINT